MSSENHLLTTDQAAERLNISVRRTQDYIANNRLLAHKVGREYRVWSHDVDRLARLMRPRGRPRRLAVSENEYDLHTANVAGAVEEAKTEEEMEEVLQEYLDWLHLHLGNTQLGHPIVTPREAAFENIEQSSRTLPQQQRDGWMRVLEREVNRERKQWQADHFLNVHHLNVKVRPKNDTDWCVAVYAPDDTEQAYEMAIIYEAAILTDICGACGQPFSFYEREMVAMAPGMKLPPLCRSCANSWNAMVHRHDDLLTAQNFEQFKRNRREGAPQSTE